MECFPLELRPPGSRSGFTIQISTSAAKQGGEQFVSPRGALGCLGEAHHAWRAPHFNGGVVAGGQQQLLVCWAEGHRVDHIIMFQASQADVVVPVPDVTVLVLCSATQTITWIRTLILLVQLLTQSFWSFVCQIFNDGSDGFCILHLKKKRKKKI